MSELNTESELYYTGITGFEPGSIDLQSEVMMSLLRMDLTCIPIAIIVWILLRKCNGLDTWGVKRDDEEYA